MNEVLPAPHQEPPSDWSIATAQRAVDASIQALGGYWPPLANLARLFEECGELARAINQTHGPKVVKPGEKTANLEEEIGDTLYVLLVLANSLDIDGSAAVWHAVERATRRAGIPILPPAQSDL
ncbi:MAG TPA: MazG nucleotide pyrophosphohydrolase domain-containing protein [Ktedonobacterales bacterium]